MEAPNRQNNKYELAEDENITQILDTISNENNNDFLPDNNRNTNYSLVKTETYNISLIEKSESSISKRGLNKNFVKPIKKNKDQTEKQKILKSLLFSFLIFLLGVVLIIIAFSKNYLMIFPLLFGGIFFILGAFFLVVSLLRLILLH